MATYLELCNQLLLEANEVELTSSDFTSSRGIQTHIKDIINRAYFDMINEEPQFPFLAVNESGTYDPLYGNAVVETVAGTRWYELKPASSSIVDDYGYVDWDNFYITTAGVSGETEPFTSRELSFITIDTFRDFYHAREHIDDASSNAQHGLPIRVIKSPDNRKFGLSPIPDKVYKVYFYAYTLPTKLSAHSDVPVFPDVYTTVLIARSRYYMHQFKDNLQAAALSLDDYRKGIRNMKLHLMSPTPKYFKDDRMVFI
jgi:hypothetical protein